MFNISTICFGYQYNTVRNEWEKRIREKCKLKNLFIWKEDEQYEKDKLNINKEYGFWDVVRLKKNLECISKDKIPIVQIDMDIILEKDIEPIINLPYDFIISTEIGGNQSFPKECSQILGFGVCSGFYIIKETSIEFMEIILNNMINKKYGSLSDQVNIMNYVTQTHNKKVYDEKVKLGETEFTNKIIEIDGIKICVLDFNIIIRDPIFTRNQFGNHINIGNIGGPSNYIKHFYSKLEDLPLTCPCNNKNNCIHNQIRKSGL